MGEGKDIELAKQAKVSPLRLLILTPSVDQKTSPSPFPSFLQQLTGTAPSADITSFAGYTSHPPLHTKTRYYESDITIWCDELPPLTAGKSPAASEPKHETSDTLHSPTSPNPDPDIDVDPNVTLSDWQDQMLSTPAREVRDVIGGIVLLLPITHFPSSPASIQAHTTKWANYISTASQLRDEIESESGRDVCSIVVLQSMVPSASNSSAAGSENAIEQGTSLLEQLEDECLSDHGVMGWDFVFWDTSSSPSPSESTPPDSQEQDEGSARNEYGELTGFARILEIVANTDWTAGPLESVSDNDNYDDDDEDDEIATIKPRTFTSNTSTTTTATDTTTNEEEEFSHEFLDLKLAMLDLTNSSSTSSQNDAAGLRAPLRPDTDTDRDDEEEQQVERLGGLMRRVVAVREAAGGMSGAERERFARREIGRIVDELDLR